MTEASRRNLLLGAVGAGALVGAAACNSNGNSNTGGGVTQNAGSVNDMVVQEGALSYMAWNQVKSNPDLAYPYQLLKESLELKQQREKLLRMNQAEKIGYAYLFSPNGQLIAFLPVQGKVSSTQSSMTTSVGVYSSTGSSGGGNVPVELPGDDLSFGKNEGGDNGQFFFTPDGVYVYWNGPILYVDAALDILQSTAVLRYKDGSKPSSQVENSTLFPNG